MAEFDYEKSVWGENTASLRWSDPTNFRLRAAYSMVRDWPSGRVLEVGCGAGQFIRAIRVLNKNLETHGCDISEAAVEIGRKIPDDVIYQVSEENKLPYPDGYFDAVFVFDVLEHVVSPEKVLKEIHRVLRSGGYFYCFVPCENDVTSLWRMLNKLGQKKDLTKKYAGHINFFTVKEFLSLADSAGFALKKKIFSEHFLGQILGVAAFRAMDAYARNHPNEQINNEQFFKTQKSGGIFSAFKKAINFLVTLESFLWSRVRSPNLHAIFKKI